MCMHKGPAYPPYTSELLLHKTDKDTSYRFLRCVAMSNQACAAISDTSAPFECLLLIFAEPLTVSTSPCLLLSSQNMMGVNIHHLKLGCSCQRLARARQRGHIYMLDRMTAACQSILKLVRLLLQRWPLKAVCHCVSWLFCAGIKPHREVKGQCHAINELHCNSSAYSQ